ncbi:MAG: hypothetical protein MJ014_05895 [Methanocorpusculum sp.]|nr:hypothetical protein [Methanocorpusculum sp.]
MTGTGAASFGVAVAADAYRRLIFPSLEREFFNTIKERADTEAISVFAENLRHLLLVAPAGEKRVPAIDPGTVPAASLSVLMRPEALRRPV